MLFLFYFFLIKIYLRLNFNNRLIRKFARFFLSKNNTLIRIFLISIKQYIIISLRGSFVEN